MAKKLFGKSKAHTVTSSQISNDSATDPNIWICPNCGTRNSKSSLSCKDCGTYK